ncbi:histidine phosphatase family protein [Leifsonia sp. YIM 134122]|uniref:Histidine phosphatase family protein n=1 Tax=Leifsonia stereocauli TaxID=3134136 RepID=A0ABU9W2P1_9MICO
MHTIYLVRHAEAEPGEATDPGLSAAGREQARALGRRLAVEPIRTVLHSPKARAAQTALTVAAHLPSAHVEATDLLDDRTAVPSASRLREYPPHRHAWLAEVPEVEQDIDGHWMTSAWNQLSAPGPEGAVLLVTHAFVVGWFVREVLGAPAEAWLRLMPVLNAGLSIVASNSHGERTLTLFNSVDHL